MAAGLLVPPRNEGDYMREQLDFLIREFYSGRGSFNDQKLFHRMRSALLDRFRDEPRPEAR